MIFSSDTFPSSKDLSSCLLTIMCLLIIKENQRVCWSKMYIIKKKAPTVSSFDYLRTWTARKYASIEMTTAFKVNKKTNKSMPLEREIRPLQIEPLKAWGEIAMNNE